MSAETPQAAPPYPIGPEEARADAAHGRDALAVCRMVDDFARLPPAVFRAKYGVATLGKGWDTIKAAAHRVVLADKDD